jgi:hypothetical protein
MLVKQLSISQQGAGCDIFKTALMMELDTNRAR